MKRVHLFSIAFVVAAVLSFGAGAHAATDACHSSSSPYFGRPGCAALNASDCNTSGGYTFDASTDTCVLSSGAAGQSGGLNLTQLNGYKSSILTLINGIIIPVLIAIAFLVFLWGVAKAYIIKGASETERATGHKIILWGIIAFVVIFAFWGILNIVLNFFNLSTGGSASGQGLNPPQL